MKQIKLKDGVTLMAVANSSLCCTVLYEKGKGYTKTLRHEFREDGHCKYCAASIVIMEARDICLGTAPELLAREDAEEVCRKYVKQKHMEWVGGFKDYAKSKPKESWYTLTSAKASFQSALSAMGYEPNEILIIKVEGEGK